LEGRDWEERERAKPIEPTATNIDAAMAIGNHAVSAAGGSGGCCLGGRADRAAGFKLLLVV
jgi:hypothetical protein